MTAMPITLSMITAIAAITSTMYSNSIPLRWRNGVIVPLNAGNLVKNFLMTMGLLAIVGIN
ncbi:MAG TPA: hypothetical protein VK663_12475 [Burkholderiales bacterium]|nr:hypothetical protein [Burkholderiales bacterium]